MKYWTQKDGQKIRVAAELESKVFKKENLTTGKATSCPRKNDGNGTREIFQSLLRVFTSHLTLLRDPFYTGNVKHNEIECSINFHA